MKLRARHFVVAMLLAVAFVLPSAGQPANDPSRWAGVISSFDKNANLAPQNAILLTGSSSFARWLTMEKDLEPLTVIPRGFGGSTMADVLHYVDRVVISYKPRAVVIYEGDNDTFHGVAPETIVEQLKEIVSKIHDALPESRIYILSVKPSLARTKVWDEARETTELYKALAGTDRRLYFIDVATPLLNSDGSVMDDVFVDDGLHLNDKGNRIWAAAIKSVLMRYEAKYEMKN